MREDYDIVGSYDNQRYPSINAERTINMFEYLDEKAKRPKMLLPTSGIIDAQLDFDGETDGSRASFAFKDAFYTVFGPSVFRTTGTIDNLVTIQIGILDDPTGYVGVDANTFQVIFVDGVAGYIWDTNANTFTKISDSSFPLTPIDVCQIDGFFIVANGGTNQFFMSGFEQGMVWHGETSVFTASSVTDLLTLTGKSNANFQTGVPVELSTTGGGVLPTVAAGDPLNTTTIYYAIAVSPVTTNPGTIKLARSYADAIAGTAIDLTSNGTPTLNIEVFGELQAGTITSHPGNIVACRTLHRRVFLFSENFTEVWENAGLGTNLPIRRTNSLLMEVGTPAIGSIATGFDRMFFLSQDKDGLGAVMEVKGSESIPVSNRALDFQLAEYAADQTKGVDDARGIMIKENGLIFYRLNFTAANHTFVLNVSMSSAQDPKWHEEEVLNGNRHPAQTHVYYQGVNFYGDYEDARMYIVSSSLQNNNGEVIRRARIGRQMTPKGYNRLRIDRFHLDVIQGTTAIPIFINSNLLAENGFDILTESESTILLDQQQIAAVGGPQPQVFFSVSKDGAQTWGYTTISTMGKIGERTYRTVWRKLGTTPRGQGFVPKIEFYNQVPFVILGAAWDYEVLPE
jgi:hypothetical protein